MLCPRPFWVVPPRKAHLAFRRPACAVRVASQPDFHDFHHQRFNCCYGNIGWLDALHGTARTYHDAKAVKRANREKAQQSWEEQAARIRKQTAGG